MKVRGVEGLTLGQLTEQLRRGGRFVVFHYAVSAGLSFRRPSAVYFVGPADGRRRQWLGLRYTLLSLLAGWWGPWGPVATARSIVSNFRGGKDVTAAVVTLLLGQTVPTTASDDEPERENGAIDDADEVTEVDEADDVDDTAHIDFGAMNFSKRAPRQPFPWESKPVAGAMSSAQAANHANHAKASVSVAS